ncbi:MAG: GNAT family N-acetyltransferase [Bacteroidales bacterium]|nr:GNAT family N-acetyltransferase [Bacteroidales bacterium]
MTFEITCRSEPLLSDISVIRNMVEETGFFRADEVDVAAELVEERVRKGESSGYHFVIAESGGKTVAYTCFGQIPCSLLSWDLYWIVTGKEWQGKGIGSRLLTLSEEKIAASGGKNVVIETSSKELYLPTQNFYSRNGYLLKARLEDFYDYGDDKLLYIKRL